MSITVNGRYQPRHRADVRNHRADAIGLLRAVLAVFWGSVRWMGRALDRYMRRTDWEMFRSAVIIIACVALYVWFVIDSVRVGR